MICYHPDPDINAEVTRDVIQAEIDDLAAGYDPRRWTCECSASHSRGSFPIGHIGSHRCMNCGYIGIGGVMWDPLTEESPNEQAL